MSIDWEAARRAFARGFAYGGHDPEQIRAYEESEKMRNELAAREAERTSEHAYQTSREDVAYGRKQTEETHRESEADKGRLWTALLALGEKKAAEGQQPTDLPEGVPGSAFTKSDATAEFNRKNSYLNDPTAQALIKRKEAMDAEAAANMAGAEAKARFPYERDLRSITPRGERPEAMTPDELAHFIDVHGQMTRSGAKNSLLGAADAFPETGGKPGAPTSVEEGLTNALLRNGVDKATIAQLMTDVRDPKKRADALMQIMALRSGGPRKPAANDPLARMTNE